MNPESRRDLLCLLESVFVGLFFVQAVRFLYGTLYAQVSSASLVNVTANREALQGQLGVVSAANVELSLAILGVALVAPLLSIVLGRLWFGVTLAAGVVAAGRVFLTANGGTTAGILGASLVVGGGMLYLTIIAGRRPGMFPVGLVGGFALDHLIRLYGNTRDLTMTAEFLNFQTILSVALFLVAVGAALLDQFGLPPTRRRVRGAISLWGAFALGGLLYLEFAVLGLANTAAHRVGLDYNALAPWLVGATLLPLVGEVRAFVRSFLNMFDTRYRGWVWFLLIALLIVIGMRLGGFPGGAALVIAQFMVCLSFWWIATPTDAQRTISGISLMFGSLVLLLLSGADFFTFEYAFVRGVQEPFASILRGFRGLGLVIIILAVLFMCLPVIVSRRRIPFGGGRFVESLAALCVVIIGGVGGASFARPVIMRQPGSVETLRIASLNLHGGYSLYFGQDLPALAQHITENGIDVLLLQDVDGGRLISFSVDQAAWLARTLEMQVHYVPTNEGLQGLAILSRLPMERLESTLLPAQGKQTALQFVRVRAQDGGTLDLYNTALTLIFPGGAMTTAQQEEEQIRQVLALFAVIEGNESLGRRVVLGGTLNTRPKGDIYTYLTQKEFADPFKDYPEERAVTLRLVNGAPLRVDYLWLKQLDAPRVGIVPIPESSHDLVIVEVRVQ